MIRFLRVVLGAGLFAAALAQAAPQTMRLDYIHSGNALDERYALDRIVIEPLPWPGNPARPIDTTNRGVNLVEVAIYIADARAQVLPLVTVGGGEAAHDWRYLLGRMGCLRADRTIGMVVRVVGHVLHAAAVIAGGFIVMNRAR